MGTTTEEIISTYARTEPSASGASPRIVRIENRSGTVFVFDVREALSATACPLPETDRLPTVGEVIHTTANHH